MKVRVLIGLFIGVAALISLLSNTGNTPSARIHGKTITLKVADTPAKRQLGLSGRSGLHDNSGMVFVFERLERRCFWMKDMQFNLDMVWLDDFGKVLDIKKDVPPSTYPETFCADGRYIIELNAGMVDQLKLHTGQTLQLNL